MTPRDSCYSRVRGSPACDEGPARLQTRGSDPSFSWLQGFGRGLNLPEPVSSCEIRMINLPLLLGGLRTLIKRYLLQCSHTVSTEK